MVTKSKNLHSKLNKLCLDYDYIENSHYIFSKHNNLIRETFNELYIQSGIDLFFWEFCTFNTFEEVYKQREIDFLKIFIDASKKDYIQSEISLLSQNYDKESYFINEYKIKQLIEGGYIYNCSETIKLNKILFSEDILKIDFSQKRKLKFLKSKLNQLKEQSPENKPIPKSETLLDYSNNPKIEKIVFLHELGILDYLQKKMIDELHNFSPNKLAEIISTFTDIEQRTAQSYLNPMFSDAKKKNTPLTKNNLKKVKEKLMKIGFNKTKTN